MPLKVVPAEPNDAEIAELHRQWAAIKAGAPTVAHDDVVRWLDTWGTPHFKPWKNQSSWNGRQPLWRSLALRRFSP
jgi:hypothetical protein